MKVYYCDNIRTVSSATLGSLSLHRFVCWLWFCWL